jgi:hypothetical protein
MDTLKIVFLKCSTRRYRLMGNGEEVEHGGLAEPG